ncbi:MAG: signal recognition particle protein, partial [Oscillospiraceae bacterium]|nr:signal recognition particle protein [Oscillospiraceae bacterium]
MAFEGLADKISNAFKKLKSKGKLSENDVKGAMREVRLALLEADVNYKVAKDFTNKVTERAIGQDVMESLTPAQMVIKIVDEELTALMGGENERLNFNSKPPTVIMMCGLQGSGKTTHSAKLAKMLKAQNRRPMLVACDIYRPAAIDQLKVVGAKADVPVFEMGTENPVKIARAAVRHAKDYGNDVVILDTAGRLHIDEVLMNELKEVKAEVNPDEILLVIDSMTGQDAVNVAKSFNDLLEITGVILTKLDGDTRGGAALSVKAVTGKPIKFAGTGDMLDDIEVFHPDRMASRILGMGDVLTLIEDAQSKLDEKKAEEMAQKMLNNKLDFNDLNEQFNQIKKMGPLKGILSKLPGIGKQLDDIDIDDRQIDWLQAIILSMTPEERSN